MMAGAVLLPLSACNGMFDDIYDEPIEDVVDGFGFSSVSDGTTVGKIYVDATSYTDWVYISFSDRKVTTLDVSQPAPENWDIAVHRYDAKTNSGRVADSGATGFSVLSSMARPTADEYVADIWTTDKIITDMSTMMDGYLSYAVSYYNAELSKWLNVDKSTMPPIYSMSNKVYLVRLADGTDAAVKLENYMDAQGIKGYLTIQYIYPLQ